MDFRFVITGRDHVRSASESVSSHGCVAAVVSSTGGVNLIMNFYNYAPPHFHITVWHHPGDVLQPLYAC